MLFERQRPNKFVHHWLSLLAISLFIIVQLFARCDAETSDIDQVVVTPSISKDVRLNPGKGWVLYGDLSAYSPEILSLGTVNYERAEWSTLEPSRGKFNWSFIDDRIRLCMRLGKQFAFGIMCSNVDSTNPYPTPKWLFDDGAASYTATSPDTHVLQTIPVWDDRVFLAEQATFAQALARRYDGNPHIAFIDIRSYGSWGEGHLYPIGGSRISPEALKEHIRNYASAFKITQLILPWGESRYNPVYDWAITQHVGIRRDGICGNSDGSETLRCLGKVPAVFEFFDSYENMQKLGWWSGQTDSSGNGHTLMTCVNNGHPSYISLSSSPDSAKIFVKEQLPLIKLLADKMGYDVAIDQVIFPGTFIANRPFQISLKLTNLGVAPIYVPAMLAVALLNPQDSVAARQVIPASEFDPGTLKSGESVTKRLNIILAPTISGPYRLAVGLLSNASAPNPSILFANSGSTPRRWLPLGKIESAVAK